MLAAIRTARQESRGLRVLLWIIIHAFIWPLRLVERLEYALTYQAVRVTNPAYGPIRVRSAINARIRIRWGGDRVLHLVMLMALVASVASFIHFYKEGMVMAYGDAIARVTMSKLVTDSINPGLPQLGFVWPWLQQLVMVPLVRNEFLYTTGLAGAITSMVSYIVGTAYVYRLVLLLTGDRKAGFTSAVALSSADVLFLQSTPMSEVCFVAIMLMGTYHTTKWVKSGGQNLGQLALAALSIMLSSMVRYEGWFGMPFLAFVILFTFRYEGVPYKKAEDRFVFFGTIASFFVVSWLFINYVYFGDALFFARSEFSAGSIARATLEGMNPADRPSGNLILSFSLYGKTAVDTVGWITSFVGTLGLIIFVFSKRPASEKWILGTVLYPFFFYLVTLYFGLGAVIWHPDFIEGANWGTRYGVLMAPAAALGVGIVAHRKTWMWIPILVLVICSTAITWNNGILSMGEAINNQTNEGALVQNEITSFMNENYDRGLVMINRFGNEKVFYESDLPLGKLAYEGSEPGFWENALENPAGTHIDWIVMRGKTDGTGQDEIWRTLRGSQVLRDHYDLVFQIEGAEIYKIKGTDLPSIGPVPLSSGEGE